MFVKNLILSNQNSLLSFFTFLKTFKTQIDFCRKHFVSLVKIGNFLFLLFSFEKFLSRPKNVFQNSNYPDISPLWTDRVTRMPAT